MTTDALASPGDEAGLPPADLSRGDCAIRPVSQGDYPWIAELWSDPQNLMSYRFGGIAPPPEQFTQLLWSGVTAQFVIVNTNRPIERDGLVTFYNRDHQAGHFGIALVLSESARRTGRAFIGAGLAIEHMFRVTRTHKIWAEVPEWNMPVLRGLCLFGFVEEGRQHQHEWIDGRYWDRYLLALFRDDWNSRRHLWDRAVSTIETPDAPVGTAGSK